jgi:hypothetical protein
LFCHSIENEKKARIVNVFSARIKTLMSQWAPCDGEGAAAAIVCKAFSYYIRESEKQTIIFTDNRPVYKASQLLKK